MPAAIPPASSPMGAAPKANTGQGMASSSFGTVMK
jgi:hypothetical protein